MEEIENLIAELSTEKPKNNIFKADDFESELIAGLKKDEILLNELNNEWKKIEYDPKIEELFNALEKDLLNKDKNATGQLIIFTESNDTADYLANKLENRIGKGILKVSSSNRNKIFETIQENFDANYLGKRKNDYQILITTDVLAEGVNLHRANVLVNYDTPWNATRLMQRIGRINRIGSVAGVVYNYIFYPSQQGDEEIKLYKNALLKLQGFHSAFGEDTQVFTHEELIEQFELFKEGMPDQEDRRLLFLRFIIEFKDANPREFKRIKNFPLKARTARKNINSNSKDSRDSTLIFLKSSYKMEFYIINKLNEVKPLTFLEAAEQFSAKISEQAFELPTNHFENVQAALMEFDKDFLGASVDNVTSTDKADAISAQAKKFLRDFKAISRKTETKKACEVLAELIDRGTFTPLPNEIRKLKRKIDKKETSYGQADNLIILLASKYDVFHDGDEQQFSVHQIDLNITPEIVISETFIH